MSENILRTNAVLLAPNALGRDWHYQRASGLQLPSEVDSALSQHSLRVALWRDTLNQKFGEDPNLGDPTRRFSLFMSLGKNHWFLARAKFITPSAGFMSGVLLTHADLERIDWASHRLLPQLPEVSRSSFGPHDIDLKKISQPFREISNTASGKRVQAVYDSLAVTMGWKGENSGFSASEFVIGTQVDMLPPALRPRSWVTTKNFKSFGSDSVNNVEWTFYPMAEDDASARPRRVVSPTPAGKTP